MNQIAVAVQHYNINMSKKPSRTRCVEDDAFHLHLCLLNFLRNQSTINIVVTWIFHAIDKPEISMPLSPFEEEYSTNSPIANRKSNSHTYKEPEIFSHLHLAKCFVQVLARRAQSSSGFQCS